MGNVEIHDLITAENISASDVISEQRNDGGTWLTRKLTFNNLGLFLNKILNYATDLNTTDKTIIGAINEILQSSGGGSTMVGGELTAGQTSITLTDSSIDSSKLFDIFVPWGINPTSEPVIDDINHTITIEFEAQSSNIDIIVEVKINGSV